MRSYKDYLFILNDLKAYFPVWKERGTLLKTCTAECDYLGLKYELFAITELHGSSWKALVQTPHATSMSEWQIPNTGHTVAPWAFEHYMLECSTNYLKPFISYQT